MRRAHVHLIRRWWLVALLVLLGALAGLIYALVSPATYTARAHIVVVAESPSDSAGAVSYAQAYARIAAQGEALAEAARASNGTFSPADLRRQVQVTSSPDAPVIEITGSAATATGAADVANVLAKGLVSVGNDHRRDTRMRLTVLSAAEPPADPTSPRMTVDVLVGGAVGLLLGGFAMLAGVAGAGVEAAPARRAADATWIGRAPAPPNGNGHTDAANQESVDDESLTEQPDPDYERHEDAGAVVRADTP